MLGWYWRLFFFQAEDGIRDGRVTGVQTCALPISCGQELWQVACQWVWNLRLSLGKTMQGAELREMEWAPPKEAPPLYVKLRTSPLDTGLEQGYPCSRQLLNVPGKVSSFHPARPMKKARASLVPFLN